MKTKTKEFIEGYNDGVLEECQRLKEEIEKIEINGYRNNEYIRGFRDYKQEVLALLDNHSPQNSNRQDENGESQKGEVKK